MNAEMEPVIRATGEAVSGTGGADMKWHIRGSSLLLVGQAVSIGVAFATQILMVRYLSKSDYGAFAYALSAVAILQTLATFGLNRAMSRFVPIYHERGEEDRALGTVVLVLGVILALGALLIAIVVGARGVIAHSFVHDRTAVSVLLILVALAPIQAVDETMMYVFAVFRRVRSIFVRTYLLAPGLKLAVVLVLVLTGAGIHFLAAGFVVAAVFGFAVYSVVLVQTLRRVGLLSGFRTTPIRIPAAAVFSLSAPLLLSDLAFVLIISSDAVILGHFRDTTEVAAFKVVQPAARLNEIVFASFLVLFTPFASRLFERGDRELLSAMYWRTAAWIAVVSFPIFALTFSLAKPFTRLMFGGRYAGSGTFLAILAVGFYVQAALGANGTTVMVFGKIAYTAVVSAIAVSVNLGLNFLLIPKYGALGAAIGTTTTQVVHNLLKQLALWRATGIPGFDRRYLRVYVTVALAAAALFVAPRVVPVGGLTAFSLAALTSILVLWINREVLEVGQMFPELLRGRVGQRFFGS